MPNEHDFSNDDDIKNVAATNGDNMETAKRKDVCRDFLNNICSRGSRCKFYHPEDSVDKNQNALSADEPYQFCIDFQNQGCFRENCRYVHALREDVDRYKRSGDVTLGLARALAAILKGDSINGIPLCKEFQNGHCARGPQCRYWHINREEERRKRFAGRSGGSPSSLAFGAYPAAPPAGAHPSRRRGDEFVNDDFGPPSKRSFAHNQPFATPGLMQPSSAPGTTSSHPSPQLVIELERRNAELTTEVESLKRELNREKERYDDLMSLFRAAQGQPAVQRSVISAPTLPSASVQPAISSLSALQPQQLPPSLQQQWNTASNSQQPNWGKFDWTPN